MPYVDSVNVNIKTLAITLLLTLAFDAEFQDAHYSYARFCMNLYLALPCHIPV